MRIIFALINPAGWRGCWVDIDTSTSVVFISLARFLSNVSGLAELSLFSFFWSLVLILSFLIVIIYVYFKSLMKLQSCYYLVND